ncbi:HSF5 protein, partial [Pheucticus melanocephalus]|nr:HSF5 protein [Pheucticus melanocephalus]
PAGLSAGTFPARLWHLVNSPHVCSVHWDNRAQGLLIDRSLFQQELLSPRDTCWEAPYSFQAAQFRSFVLQLHCYRFHRVRGWVDSAEPATVRAWLHYS